MDIVVFSTGYIRAWGIDPALFEARVKGLPAVDRVISTPDWRLEGLADDACLYLVGRREPLPGVARCQHPVMLDDLRWMRGERLDSAAALLSSALVHDALNAEPAWETIDISDRILVVGDGCGREAVVEMTRAGRPVIWVVGENRPGFEDLAGVETVTCRRLKALSGRAGRFEAVLETSEGERSFGAGIVVLAGDPVRTVWDLGVSANASGISEFESRMQGDATPWTDGQRFDLVFACGETASTNSMKRLLEAARWAAGYGEAAVYMMAPQVKVASLGLERLYGEAREAGVTFLRPPAGGPELTVVDGRVNFKIFDAVAGADLCLEPDMVVVEEPLGPGPEVGCWSEAFRLSLASDHCLGPDNVLFLPALTNRRGILAMGPARGTDSAEVLAAETAGVMAESGALLHEAESAPLRVHYDESCCAYCLSCVRICPHGAIEFTSRPWFDPLACVACGLCVARCPGKALTISGFADDQLLQRIRILVSRPKSDDGFLPRIVMFGCRRSAQKAMETASPNGAADLVFIPLPCGGKLEDHYILRAFLQGADGVMVAVCHEDNCRTEIGGPEAARRVGRVYQLMGEVGANPERLKYMTLAPNQGVDFARNVAEFTDVLKDLGPGMA